ncbi:putative spermidine/putrescine transport system permease protein [Polaromonas sp. OV174]|nr:putative spermidine/putrescine transport system permease protein [Polaromonas sp. OV174]
MPATVVMLKPTASLAPTRRAKLRLHVYAWNLLLGIFYAFILSPLFFVVWLSFFKDAIVSFPPTGYTTAWYVNVWHNPAFADGFILSVKIACATSLFSVIFGTLAAIGIKRSQFRGSEAIKLLLLSPLVLPGIVAGIAVYLLYQRIAQTLDLDIAGSFAGLLVAHISLTIPWTVRLVSASIDGLDQSIEDAARNLGANAFQVFRLVTLPMLRPAIVASVLFSFIVSFENLEVSLLLVGPGNTTLPIAIMQYLEFNLDPTIAAVSSVQILLLGIVMIVTDRFVQLSKVV